MHVVQLGEPEIHSISADPAIAQRQQAFYAAAREFFRPVLNDSDASWKIPLTHEQGRIDLQIAYAFLAGDDRDVELANKLIRRAPVPVFESGSGQTHRFGIFLTSLAAEVLTRFEDRLQDSTIDFCEQLLREGHGDLPSNWAADYQFHGMNDNMPAMACKSLILGGQRLGREDWCDMGQWRLEQFANQLSRHGLIGEYTSPNYTPDTIHCLQVIATYANHPHTKQLAQDLANRIWLDLAVHWHPQARTLAGPFSRAYAADFNAHLSTLQAVVWTLWGDDVSGISPFKAMAPDPGLHVLHCGDLYEHTARMCYCVSIDQCMITPQIKALFESKPADYSAIATAEQGDCMDSPCRVITSTMHMQPHASLGTASSCFCNGQQTAAMYITAAAAENSQTTGPVCFTKYLVDDEQPDWQTDSYWHRHLHGPGEYFNHATAITVQHQSSALLSYVPHRQQLVDQSHHRLRLAMIIPTGLHPLTQWACQSHRTQDAHCLNHKVKHQAKQWFGFTLGQAMVAFRPLVCQADDTPMDCYVQLHQADRYTWFEVVNYAGDPRDFSTSQYAHMLNGMVIEVTAASSWESLDHWLADLVSNTRFMDYFYFNHRRLRYHRNPMLGQKPVELELIHSTWADGSAVRVVNGRRAPEPAWDVTGLPADSLSFLGSDGPVMLPMTLPWEQLTAGWNPYSHWAISDNGV
ncbi:MAG TPA: hypothetical protein DCM28_21010 [Phycisphaerales bacterium]|nr:hypothetical protein [Phycisphaerales bacterium]|tara:strand:- start:28209 stop:30281 length:2073 start_codon:yes stop_codon:yes gene_type:complete